MRQKKAVDILPGYTGSPGCGSLEEDRAGTRWTNPDLLIVQFRALPREGLGTEFYRHRKEVQFGGPENLAKLSSGDTVRSHRTWLESRSEFPPSGQWVLRSGLLNYIYIWKPTQGNSLFLHS